LSSEKTSNRTFKQYGADGLEQSLPAGKQTEDLKLIKKLCKKSDKILDLACGYGRLTISLSKLGYNILGMDLSPTLIKAAKRKAKNKNIKTQFDLGNMLRLPYKNNSFDKVICFWTSFNHLLTKIEQIKALNEIFRILRSHGLAFIETFNGEAKPLKEHLKQEGYGPEKRLAKIRFYKKNSFVKGVYYFHDRKSLLAICKASKFEHYKIGCKNISGERRLTASLYK